MIFSTWLELRCGAPGLGGPFLLEHLGPYSAFSTARGPTPAIVVAIGGMQKRQFLERHFSVSHVSLKPNIRMGYFPKADSILLDCEMHNVTYSPRVKAGPSSECNTRHELHHGSKDTRAIAHGLYNQILMPLAAVTMLFVADLGGWDMVMKLLAFWAQKPLKEAAIAPSIVTLISEGNLAQTTAKDVTLQASTELLQQLRMREPTKPFTRLNAEAMISQRLIIKVFHRRAIDRDTHDTVLDLIRKASSRKYQTQLAFSVRDTIFLLRAALVHYAGSPGKSFDCYLALRNRSGIPSEMVHYLRDASKSIVCTIEKKALVIASILWLDAFPSGLHRFAHNAIFSTYYAPKLVGLDEWPTQRGLMELVRYRFAELGCQEVSNHIERHITILNSLSNTISTCSETCVICFSRAAMFTLDCQHRLCNGCTTSLGQQQEPWVMVIQRCPVCSLINTANLTIRPPTAGPRILQLGGNKFQPIWDFLYQVKKMLHPGSLPISHFFDCIIAEGAGIYFALSLFLESWSMKDCGYHLSRLKQPKFVKSDIVTFGRGLEWNLTKVIQSNHVGFLIVGKHRFYSNFIPQKACGVALSNRMLEWTGKPPDITIEYNGGIYEDSLLKTIPFKLVSCLFYIELMTSPIFYTTPTECRICLRCRINPGPALMNLLMELHQRQTCIQYRSAESHFTETPLYTNEIWRKCSQGLPFSKELILDVLNMDSMIEVEIDGLNQCSQSVSNCPYRLRNLLQDQGLDSAFTVPGIQAVVTNQKRDSHMFGNESFMQSMKHMYEVLDQVSSFP